MSVKNARNIHQLKVTLMGFKPPIWRTILVPSNIGLDSLHLVLQITMGWTNSHLHQFISGRTLYSAGYDDLDFGFDAEDESRYKISRIMKNEKDSIKYEYDFGDGWEHKVVLEKILPFDPASQLPRCIKGKRACPPEDCGGIWGYQNFIEVLQDSGHSEHEEMLEWVGGDFDPEWFDLQNVNEILAEHVK